MRELPAATVFRMWPADRSFWALRLLLRICWLDIARFSATKWSVQTTRPTSSCKIKVSRLSSNFSFKVTTTSGKNSITSCPRNFHSTRCISESPFQDLEILLTHKAKRQTQIKVQATTMLTLERYLERLPTVLVRAIPLAVSPLHWLTTKNISQARTGRTCLPLTHMQTTCLGKTWLAKSKS